MDNLRSVLTPAVWEADWGETHARLDEVKNKLGDALWTRAKTQVTGTDRELIDLMLIGDLDT